MVYGYHQWKWSWCHDSVCISLITNTLGERYDSNYSPSSYGLIVGQTKLFNLDTATGL